MKVIYKYDFKLKTEFEIFTHEVSEILSVQIQRAKPVMWILVDCDSPAVLRRFCLRATGEAFNGNEKKYIGTFQYDNYVFHVFEEKTN